MLNIVVPLAGLGSRFLHEGYWRPKPFIKARGKELILWLLENLSLQSSDYLVLVFNRNPDIGVSPTNFVHIINDALSRLGDQKPNVTYVFLEKSTVGAAETVLRGIEKLPSARLGLPCILLDGDTFYKADVLSIYRQKLKYAENLNEEYVLGGCVFVFDDDKPTQSPYSYVQHKSNSARITEIQEKNKVGMSALACSGCYCFHSTQAVSDEICTALKLHTSMCENREIMNNCDPELYTSSIIAKMLQKSGDFQLIKLSPADFVVLGTPAQLQNFIISKSDCGESKRFCFDLDNTLVTSPILPGDYKSCQPISHVIDYVKRLYSGGHYIIIHTARRMRTHSANVGSVIADIGALTIDQLDEFDIPYHELLFGKPFADFYVDDKAVLPFLDEIHKETGVL